MPIMSVIGLLILIWVVFTIFRTIRIVPQQQAWIVERLGRFHAVLGSGMNFVMPLIDRVAYPFDMRETPRDFPGRVCNPKDTPRLSVDGVLYYQITNAQNAAYGTNDVITAVVQLVQTTMRA